MCSLFIVLTWHDFPGKLVPSGLQMYVTSGSGKMKNALYPSLHSYSRVRSGDGGGIRGHLCALTMVA